MSAHSERAHALLSASGSKRWLACTPSARAEEQYLKELEAQGITEPESVYAQEGTAAHEYSELILHKELGNITKAQATRRMNKFRKENEFYSEEMEEYVHVYTDYVLEKVSEAQSLASDALVLIEQKLDYSEWVEEGFGTGDVLIIADSKLDIIDLKYGKGVPVSAVDNPQMKLYALGALAAYAAIYDIDEVCMTIVQPRLDNISSFTISTEDLMNWAENEVKPKASEAYEGSGDYVAGDHCRFCKIKGACRERAKIALEMAKADFAEDGSIEVDLPEPATLSTEELAEIMFIVDDVEKWCKDLKSYALEQVVNGTKLEGFKLVEGRSNRKITDESAAVANLTDHLSEKGVNAEEVLYSKALISLTNIEKLVGKKTLTELLGNLIYKAQGKPVLVTADDPRNEIHSVESAANDFADDLLD